MMKKLLSAFLIVGTLVACKDSKKNDATTATDTKTEIKGDVKIGASADVPKFEDADVQKMAEEYANFVKGYASADPAKVADYAKRAQDWANKMQAPMQKLAANPEEMKKFTDFMDAMAKEMISKK